jgi:hypothetical protein
MLTQTIDLLASARPNLGRQLCRTRRRCSGRPAARWAGQVGEEAVRVPGVDGGGPAAWRGARASADFGRPATAENPVEQRTGAPRKAAVGEDDGGSRGGGHDDDDGGGSGTKSG